MGFRIEYVELGPSGHGAIGPYDAVGGVLLPPCWLYRGGDPVLSVRSPSMRTYPFVAGHTTAGWKAETEGGAWTWPDAVSSVPLPAGIKLVEEIARTQDGACWVSYQGGEVLLRRAGRDLSDPVTTVFPADAGVRWLALSNESLLLRPDERCSDGFARVERIGAPQPDDSAFELPAKAWVRAVEGGAELHYLWFDQGTMGIVRRADGKHLWSHPRSPDDVISAFADVVVVGRPVQEGSSRIEVFDIASGTLKDSWDAGLSRRAFSTPMMRLATDGRNVVWHISPVQLAPHLPDPPMLQWRPIGADGTTVLPCPPGFRVRFVHFVRTGFFAVAGGLLPHYPDGPRAGREGYLMMREVEGPSVSLETLPRPTHSIAKVPRQGGKHGFEISIHEPKIDRLVRYAWVLLGEVATEYGYVTSKAKSSVDKKFDGSLELVVDRDGYEEDPAPWLDLVVKLFELPMVTARFLAGDCKSPLRVSWRWK